MQRLCCGWRDYMPPTPPYPTPTPQEWKREAPNLCSNTPSLSLSHTHTHNAAASSSSVFFLSGIPLLHFAIKPKLVEFHALLHTCCTSPIYASSICAGAVRRSYSEPIFAAPKHLKPALISYGDARRSSISAQAASSQGEECFPAFCFFGLMREEIVAYADILITFSLGWLW